MKTPTPKQYHDLFQVNNDGKDVLVELSSIFYDVPSFDADNPHKTSYNEGRRSVIEFILRKISQVNIEPTADDSFTD